MRGDVEAQRAKVKASEEAARKNLKSHVLAQGATFRVVAERVIFAESFSSVAGKLTSISGGKIADRIFERLQQLLPELERSMLGYVPLLEKAFQREYVRIFLNALDSSEVLKAMSSQHELMSADQINQLPIDRDANLEPILVRLKVGKEVSSEGEEKDDEEDEDEDEEAEGGAQGEGG